MCMLATLCNNCCLFGAIQITHDTLRGSRLCHQMTQGEGGVNQNVTCHLFVHFCLVWSFLQCIFYRVCHEFRLTKLDDYFLVNFDLFINIDHFTKKISDRFYRVFHRFGQAKFCYAMVVWF